MKIATAVLAILMTTAPNMTDAAEGDTVIYVYYKVNSVRVRPTARTGGATVDFRIVLHKDGAVDDTYAVKDGEKGSSKTKLGKQPRIFNYRVVDANTIERTLDRGTHFHKLTVRVAGKNCTAAIDFVLKPGQSEFKEYSTELKAMAYYSSIKTEYATCVIE